MEIESNKVWDFSKENYVNRLIQNELDGKLVEVGGDEDQIISQNIGDSHTDKEVHLDSVFRYNKKIESLNHEYNTILIKTLEDQKQYFEK